jgi:hypothetical protein
MKILYDKIGFYKQLLHFENLLIFFRSSSLMISNDFQLKFVLKTTFLFLIIAPYLIDLNIGRG